MKVVFNPASAATPSQITFAKIPLQGVFKWSARHEDKDRAVKVSENEYVYPHTMWKYPQSNLDSKVFPVGLWADGDVVALPEETIRVSDLPVNTVYHDDISNKSGYLYSIRTFNGVVMFYADGSYGGYATLHSDEHCIKRSNIIGKMEVSNG